MAITNDRRGEAGTVTADRRGEAAAQPAPGGVGGHFGAPHYGQFGSSREPILNSAGGMPNVWFTLSIFRSTLL